MKKLTCEMCGSTDIVKENGVFVCKTCGCKYSVEEAKKMMIEGTVDVTGSTIKVDNTGLVDNYLAMAKNALNTKNLGEAENYANRIIEIDPKSYQAWFIKGKASCWQTTGNNNRFSEGVVNFINSFKLVPDSNKKALTFDIMREVATVGVSIIQMKCNSYTDYSSENNAVDIINSLKEIAGSLNKLEEETDIDAFTSEFKNILATLIQECAVNVAHNAKSDYYGLNIDFCDDEACLKYEKTLSTNLRLLESAYDLCNDPDVNSAISLNCYQINDILKGLTYYTSRYQDGIRRYDEHKLFNNQSRVKFYNDAEKWQEKASFYDKDNRTKCCTEACELFIGFNKQLEEKIAIDKYWSEHSEEKASLCSEEEQYKVQLTEVENKKNSDPLFASNKELHENITKLEDQKNSIGVFKMKEKKAIQEQIDIIQKSIDNTNKKVSVLEENYNSQINDLKNKISIIGQKLCANRGTEKITHIKTPISITEGIVDCEPIGLSLSPLELVHYLNKYLPEPYGLMSDDEECIINASKELFESNAAENGSDDKYVDDPNKNKIYKIMFAKNKKELSSCLWFNAKSESSQIVQFFGFVLLDGRFSSEDAADFVMVVSLVLFNLLPSLDFDKFQVFLVSSIYSILIDNRDFICDGVKISSNAPKENEGFSLFTKKAEKQD